MGLDIRKPIGLLLGVIGIQLAVFGLAGDASIYQRSLGLNVNLVWGLALSLAGGLFLLWSRFAVTRDK
jgi:hypothetical protein